MPKIVWIEATHGSEKLRVLWDELEKYINKLVAGRAEVDFRHLPFNSGGIRTSVNRLVNDTGVLAAALNSKTQSDLTIVGCWGAPTEVIRAALNSAADPVPITGLTEASVRTVNTLSKNAAIVTVAEALVPIFTEDVKTLGDRGFLESKPVVAYSPDSSHQDILKALEDPEHLIQRFEQKAMEAVERGADAIVAGCGYLGAIFDRADYRSLRGAPEVPVLDPNRLAVEYGLMLLGLQRAGIRASTKGFLAPNEPQMSPLLARLG